MDVFIRRFMAASKEFEPEDAPAPAPAHVVPAGGGQVQIPERSEGTDSFTQ